LSYHKDERAATIFREHGICGQGQRTLKVSKVVIYEEEEDGFYEGGGR
jgi:hypothetical protein